MSLKFVVPSGNHTLKSRLEWFCGLADADGTITDFDGCLGLQIGSVEKGFLRLVQLMLQTVGVRSKISNMRDAGTVQIRSTEKVYPTKPLERILIAHAGLMKLLDLGATFNRLKTNQSHQPNRSALRFVRVTAVEDRGRVDDTYCFNEPKQHMAIFNGVISSQCTEILEVTSSGKQRNISRGEMNILTGADLMEKGINITGYDRKADSFEAVVESEVSVCNLGSINLARGYIKQSKLDKEKLRKNVSIAVKYLDRVINRNFYPIPEAESSNMRWRPVGLGLMGLADFFMQLRIPYDSEKAVQLSAEIQEEIYYHALKTSCDLAKELGRHRDFHLTRAAHGDLQFDLAGVEPDDRERWDALKLEIKEHGLRNSLLIAIAPTATISHICGVEEAIEPIKSNLLKRETLSGEFVAINKYLVEDLRKLGRWNAETIAQLKVSEGSIASITGLPIEMYATYKTVWEMSMKSLIAHAVARGAYIDQSHSLNMFIDLNKYPEDKRIGVLSSLYMHAWESGVKTTYYFRSRAATRIQQTTVQTTGYANGHGHMNGVTELTLQVTPSPMAPEESEVCESCT
jgi:ribonucleotide reductase alpha subunit